MERVVWGQAVGRINFRVSLLVSAGLIFTTPLLPEAAEPEYSPEVLNEKVTFEKFGQLDWQRRSEALQLITSANFGGDDEKIINAALADDNKLLVQQALRIVTETGSGPFSKLLPPFLDDKDVMVKYRALLAIEKDSVSAEILPKIIKLTRDKEWMIREAAFRQIRRYKSEKSARQFFYDVLFHVNERNPQVVIEVYRTLIWYDDETAWPYLLKRSYHCKSAAELIGVLRELARIKTRDVQGRLKTLTRSQSMLIRQEAAELLREYY